eukprot:TRINITY_DN5006_c0_g1_i2.p3 TRINITY_DN5006_c0_g1~~TRINITY_DN5006_c0_g1_i2.p3  ORF type:complete len:101 (-),score=17.30 TRINITY_DN5006_c0_g1_i2:91-393(-)
MNSSEIAPLGTRTGDWTWRERLGVDDVVDVFDTQGKWYLGTILEVTPTETKANKLKVGFRVYLAEGTKSDSKGKYEGWSSTYDAYLSAYSIRIQRLLLAL